MSNQSPLLRVVSLGEATMLWERDRKAIIWQYWNGFVEMRKSGHIWLVDFDSMVRVYGFPYGKTLPDIG